MPWLERKAWGFEWETEEDFLNDPKVHYDGPQELPDEHGVPQVRYYVFTVYPEGATLYIPVEKFKIFKG